MIAFIDKHKDTHGIESICSISYTERLTEIGAAPSIGSVGDPTDNAVAESTIDLYKTELINPQRP